MNYILLNEVGVKTNFNSFNSIQNKYNSKEYTPKRKPPKKLIKSVIREFEVFCKSHHIDNTKYKFIEPCELEGVWRQFDFLDSNEDEYPARIIVSGIISNNNGKIFQRVIEI